MSKTFVLSIENLQDDADIKRIENHFKNNLPGIEHLDINLSLKIVSVRYNDSIGSPNSILGAFNYLGYSVR